MAPPREVRRSKWIFSDLESTGACGGLLWFLRCFVTYHRDTSAIEQSNPSANRIDTMPTREARVSMWLSASTKRLIDENLHDEKHHVSDGADSEVERGKPRRFTAHGEHDLLEPHGEHQNRHHQVKKRSLLAKDEGGLGIRALKDVNMVCGLKLIWG